MGHLLGYARVSTTDQQPQLQVDALQRAGCYRVFTETASGAAANRPVLKQLLDQLRPGDTLVVWKLDRLGRSLRHLVDTVTGLADRGVGFRSLQEAIDTTTPGGKLVFHVFAALAEFERDLIRERTTAGLAAARVLRALWDHGPLTAEQLAAQLSTQGRTARVATIDQALAELAAAGAATADPQTQRWTLLPGAQHPLLDAVDLHGAHDFRHTFSTWLEDAGVPARVIDELMGHQASGRSGRHQASAIGAHYRHTTPEMAARVVAAVEQRLVIVLATAEAALDQQPW